MSAEEAAARVEYPLTFDVLGTSRRFSDTTLSGPDLINTHDPSTTSSGLWSDFDDPRTDDTAGWIDKFAAMALSEAVHEALEWFRVDGQQYLDPHGCQADAINAEVTALCARLALLRQGSAS